MTPLLCARCGAPLPVDALLPFVTCAYCDTTLARHGHSFSIAAGAAPAVATVEKPYTQRRAFEQDVAETIAAGKEPARAIEEAALRHLGEVEHSYAIATVTMALADAFAREHDVRLEGAAYARLASAYLNALVELRSCKSTELNLPFLAVTNSGPKHLGRTLTPEIIAHLASGAVAPVAAPRAEEQVVVAPAYGAPPPVPSKKKWYWPFGS